MAVATLGFCSFVALIMSCAFFCVHSHYHNGWIWNTWICKFFREKRGPESAHSVFSNHKRHARIENGHSLKQVDRELEDKGYRDELAKITEKDRKRVDDMRSKHKLGSPSSHRSSANGAKQGKRRGINRLSDYDAHLPLPEGQFQG